MIIKMTSPSRSAHMYFHVALIKQSVGIRHSDMVSNNNNKAADTSSGTKKMKCSLFVVSLSLDCAKYSEGKKSIPSFCCGGIEGTC